MELAGAEYVPEYLQRDGWFHLGSNEPYSVAGYAWVLPVSSGDGQVRMLGGDSVAVVIGHAGSGVARVRVGRDTIAFDLRPIVRHYADSAPARGGTLEAPLVIEGSAGKRRSALVLTQLSGQLGSDSVRMGYWGGSVLLGE